MIADRCSIKEARFIFRFSDNDEKCKSILVHVIHRSDFYNLRALEHGSILISMALVTMYERRLIAIIERMLDLMDLDGHLR